MERAAATGLSTTTPERMSRVFLLAVYGKDTKDNLSQAERNALRTELTALADDYRSGVAARAAKHTRRKP
jgi:hypothetical protein